MPNNPAQKNKEIRIVAVADIHGKSAQIKKILDIVKTYTPDLLLLAGDILSPFSPVQSQVLLNSIQIPKLSVMGNSELMLHQRIFENKTGSRLLSHIPVTHSGFEFIGFSGTIPLPFLSKICLGEKRLLSKAPTALAGTIVVSHPPPRGTLDKVGGKFHAGSISLRDWIRKHQPAMLICGHIHEASGIDQIGRTKIINCAMNKSCSAIIIDCDRDMNTKMVMVR